MAEEKALSCALCCTPLLLACAGRLIAVKDVPRHGLLPCCPNPSSCTQENLALPFFTPDRSFDWLLQVHICKPQRSNRPWPGGLPTLELWPDGVAVELLLLLFSCLDKSHSELWPGLGLRICKVLTILCSSVCSHLHFGIITSIAPWIPLCFQ